MLRTPRHQAVSIPRAEPFDHNFHEAIFEAERADQPAGTIVQVLQPGYVLHDRLLRPAMVGVAKAGAERPKPPCRVDQVGKAAPALRAPPSMDIRCRTGFRGRYARL